MTTTKAKATTTKTPARKAAPSKAATTKTTKATAKAPATGTVLTTTTEIDAALAALARTPGKTVQLRIDLAGTTINAVRVRILRTPRRHGWPANAIKLLATEGTVITLEVTNTGTAAKALPASAGGPATA